jgi:hypothetical protein
MWKNRQHYVDDEKLDRFSDELLRAFEASDAEVSNAATSPFLYRRIRVRIEAEERRLAEQRSQWFAFLVSVKHALPVLATLAIVAIGALWYLPSQWQQQIPGEEPPTLMSDVFAFSQDEMLASAVGLEAGQSRQSGEKR